MVKVYIKTYGCSANKADSESIAYLVKKSGHDITNCKSNADLIIVNTCAVKTPTENKILNYLSKLNKPTIVSGCIPQAEPELIKSKLKDFSIVGVYDISNISKAIENTLAGEKVVYIDSNASKKIGLKKLRKNNVIAIVPISEGCLGNCTYCLTKKARGHLFSFPENEILSEVKEAVEFGYKEIWITSQDNSAYGLDGNTNLAKLLNKIVQIEGDFSIRVGMMNPNHVLKFLPDLVKAYKNPKIFKFLHIPVQAGNNIVLKNMNRLYSIDDFKHIISEFRKEIPEITISTDIICGFPGETKEQFQESIKLIKWLKPAVLNISRFWERPGTLAIKMPDKLTGGETNERSRELNLVFNNIVKNTNKMWLNWSGPAIVDETGSVTNTVVARNFAYKPIVIKKPIKMGASVNVKITENKGKYLVGEV